MGSSSRDTDADTECERCPAAAVRRVVSAAGPAHATSGATRSTAAIDLETESSKLCHACSERKRFAGLICDAYRQRHGV
ncbi:hypothetical protein [Natrinema sp. 1APR25-10V2]|uniref:hypothetical protein n=1 Tax=Natrinema sp. 1APR25-10V2 TaxID=2951081 RepID=UPI0028740D5B|nr:hypothetical protein [Natrinema sp. 1APR25-10V2]MDS0475723.1 hypothetical protein [Natrinema sp. 1APR25-10V2]